MIDLVDGALTAILEQELSENPAWKGQLPQIVFGLPDAATPPDSLSRIHLYLHDIRENVALRNDEAQIRYRGDSPPRPGCGKNEVLREAPPVRINLSYLITVESPKSEVGREHRLLSDLMEIFLRQRVPPTKWLPDALKRDGLLLSVGQPEHLPMQDPTALWRSLNRPLRPSLSLVVLATLRPMEPRWTRIAREILLGIWQGTTPGDVTRPVSLTAQRARIAGIVSILPGGDPLTEVEVTVDEMPQTRTQTDARGFFALCDLPSGTFTVRFFKPGFTATEERVTLEEGDPPDSVKMLSPTLSPVNPQGLRDWAAGNVLLVQNPVRRVTLTGTLHYATGEAKGKPAAFIPVRAGNRRSLTDKNGVYFLADVPEDMAHELVAEVPFVGDVPLSEGDTEVSYLTSESSVETATKERK